jgi:type II secretory pathway pseudopilin PulG
MLQRRGTTLVEIAVAGALLAMLMAFAFQVLALSAAQQRAQARRQRALAEASNAMERLAALPWDQLTSERAESQQRAQPTDSIAPSATWSVDIAQPPGEPNARRIAVEVRWPDAAGLSERPVRLVAWRYRPPNAPKGKP